jgi:hypothetical protein
MGVQVKKKTTCEGEESIHTSLFQLRTAHQAKEILIEPVERVVCGPKIVRY